MKHTITEFKEWPKGLEVSYHDWVIKATKNEIAECLGFEPIQNRTGKCRYTWKCNLDNGGYYFTVYDMSYDEPIKEDEEVEYHIGFNCRYDDIHEFWPNTIESLDMLEALDEVGLTPRHSDIWTQFHTDGTLQKIEEAIRGNL